jgi:serine protease Do
MSRSVSLGIISCTNLILEDVSEYSTWLQSDASTSPGTSGGPLVSLDGKVVGINARGEMVAGNLAFAIPSETVVHVVSQIRKHGKAYWSWTGLKLQPLKDFNHDRYFEGVRGVVVSAVDIDSPAAEAGIKPTDRLMAINGVAVNGLMEEDLPDIRLRLALLTTQEPVRLDLASAAGRPYSVQVTPREKGVPVGAAAECPLWNMTVKSINRFESPQLFAAQQQGVYVYGVKRMGPADRAGLLPQDIVTKLGSTTVRSLEDLQDAYRKATADSGAGKVVFTVLRGGLVREVLMDLTPANPEEVSRRP